MAKKEIKFIKDFKKSAVYQEILKGSDNILISNIKNAIGLTSDIDTATAIKVLTYYTKQAIEINDMEAVNVLNKCIEILNRRAKQKNKNTQKSIISNSNILSKLNNIAKKELEG